MSSKLQVPIPSGGDTRKWIDDVTTFLRNLVQEVETPAPKIVQLEHRRSGAKATSDGIMMWDRSLGCPVVSFNNQWYRVNLTVIP